MKSQDLLQAPSAGFDCTFADLADGRAHKTHFEDPLSYGVILLKKGIERSGEVVSDSQVKYYSGVKNSMYCH